MRKFDNFSKALNNLKDVYNYEEPYENVIITGLVSLYAICFEQSWKAMKELLEDSGFDMASSGSPRQIIKTAYQAGMICDEEIWLSALKSRNDVAHSYNQDIAMDIIRDTRDKYYEMFANLREVIQDEWL